MRKCLILLAVALWTNFCFAQTSGLKQLDEWTKIWKDGQKNIFRLSGRKLNSAIFIEIDAFSEKCNKILCNRNICCNFALNLEK